MPAYGVTTVQSMGTDGDAIFPLRATNSAAAGRTWRASTRPRASCSRAAHGGVPGINHPRHHPAEAKAEVDAQVAKSVDFIKLWVDDELHSMPKMPAEISKAVIDEALPEGERALAHVFYLEDAQRLVDQGIDGFVHSVRDKPIDPAAHRGDEGRAPRQVAASTLSREAAIPAFGRALSNHQGPLLPPVDLAGGRSRPAGEPELGEDGLVQSELQVPAGVRRAGEGQFRHRGEGWRSYLASARMPALRVACPANSEHWELWQMVSAGLTPLQAITAAARQRRTLAQVRDRHARDRQMGRPRRARRRSA